VAGRIATAQDLANKAGHIGDKGIKKGGKSHYKIT
jgi:hypothetical protein